MTRDTAETRVRPSMRRCLVTSTALSATFFTCLCIRWWTTSNWISPGKLINPAPYHIALANVTRKLTLEESMASERDANHTKTILLVGKFYLRLSNLSALFKSCPVASCRLVQESYGVDPKKFDVIMFADEIDTKKLVKMFLPKPHKQIWIASHRESSARNRLKTGDLGTYINWSASYRPDSHILIPYGRFYRKKPEEIAVSSTPTVINWAANKTKKVAWLVSNCKDKNGRGNYALQLAKYITVDIYGRCGTLTCDKTVTYCLELIKRDYKFYLAFENSNCRYYMTEKLFLNAYSNNVIPVVMGAHPADYARALPPHSYINVEDFDSPRDLANYLHRLDTDDRLYNEYFRWKTDWSLSLIAYDLCGVCGLLHAADFQHYVHWYPEYTQYWDANSCSRKWTNKNGVWWQHW